MKGTTFPPFIILLSSEEATFGPLHNPLSIFYVRLNTTLPSANESGHHCISGTEIRYFICREIEYFTVGKYPLLAIKSPAHAEVGLSLG
jgi:hypothetical protein